MSEIASNFGINSFLFKVTTFSGNYGLQTANEGITSYTRAALRYLWYFCCQPCFSKYPKRNSLTKLQMVYLVVNVMTKIKLLMDFLLPFILFAAIMPQHLTSSRSSSPTTNFIINSRLECPSLNKFTAHNRIFGID